MRKIFTLITLALINAQCAFANPNSGEELETALRDSSNDPSLSTIVFALLLVIFLIYITGVIYSKLNIVGAKTVKNQLKNYDLNKAVVVSTTQLGQNRNLHVVELNEKCYLIGATPNSINLIKDLGELKNADDKNYEKPADADIDKAIRVLYGKDDDSIIAQAPDDDFDVHKKYLQ